MTATERLRQLLDERGVVYSREGCETFFKNVHIWAINDKELCISISGLSPEQAVDATLGRGTCKDLAEFRGFGTKTEFKCSECGYEYSAVGGFGCDYGDAPEFNYCPNCGRKVVE